MKTLLLTIGLAGLVAGCSTTTQPITHAALRAAVTLGEQYALQVHPEATPYLQAATPVVCAVANGTNANPQTVVDALSGVVTNAEAKIIINGSLALLNVAVASITNAPDVALYVKDLCVGMENGLPPTGPNMRRAGKLTNAPHLR